MGRKIRFAFMAFSGILLLGVAAYLVIHPTGSNPGNPEASPYETIIGETQKSVPGNTSTPTASLDSGSQGDTTNSAQSSLTPPENSANSTQSNASLPQEDANSTRSNTSVPEDDANSTQSNVTLQEDDANSTQSNASLPEDDTNSTQSNASLPEDDANSTQSNASLTEDDANSTQTNSSIPSPANITDLVNASNQFAMEMYSNLTKAGDNLFFSPYSIFTAFGMLYEGARNKTADEMRDVFHFPADRQTRWSLCMALIEKMNSGDLGCNLSTANALWIDKDFKILSDYARTVQTYYKAEVHDVDFKNAAEAARQLINSWVENKTNGKIKEAIPPKVLDPTTRLVLTNAIHFKGDWVKSFNSTLTQERDFHTGSGTTVKANMMAMEDEESVFNFIESDGLQILEMPYSGENLSMLFLLPPNGAMGQLENNLTLQKLSEWREELVEQRVDVYIPRFKLETSYILNSNLAAMGMPTAFTSSADFSGINGKPDIFISLVIHKAYVSVNESGTEAAAVTVIIGNGASQGQHHTPIFNADHPFIFIIQEKQTGNILFMGKLSDPTK